MECDSVQVELKPLKIAYYRKLRGHTQETLAEAADINATFLGQVECGIKTMSWDNIFKLAQVLKVPEMKFFDYEND
ncbi:MAG: helix-turn-helix domain-containing protein [Oscillospiraceae bacterium]|nr:helix-turn-helix domain-containing protein [Oscillospiraceae bacterium]